MKIAVIFGSGKCTKKSNLYKSAEKLGSFLAEQGIDIATGGYQGVMEAASKGASKHKVNRIGVVFRSYKSVPNPFITQIIETSSYLERLQKFVELGDTFFIFEGGSGTLLEFCSLIALKERNIVEGKIFCIGKKWKKLFYFLNKTFKLNLEEMEGRGIFFLNSVEEFVQLYRLGTY